jgi:positive regulator of sigma E activity
VKNECAAEINDSVRVEIRAEAFLSAALILYGFPFMGLITGFVIGFYLGAGLGLDDGAAFTGVFGGLALAGLVYAVIKHMEPRWRGKGYTPVATAVVPKT